MPVSDAQKRARAKWDKTHMTTMTIKLTRDMAAQFEAAARALGLSRGEIVRRAIREAIEQAAQAGDRS